MSQETIAKQRAAVPRTVGARPARRRRTGIVRLPKAGMLFVAPACVDAPPVVTEEVRELAADLGTDEAQRFERQARQGRNEFIARIDPKSDVRTGDMIELAVDTAQMHFFDQETGEVVH